MRQPQSRYRRVALLTCISIVLVFLPGAQALAAPALLQDDEADRGARPAQEQVHQAEHTTGIPHEEAPLPPRREERAPPAAAVVTATAVGVGMCALAFILGGARFVTTGEALAHESRRAMYAFIQQNPGSSQRAIARALDLSTNNAIWHLAKLEAAGLVQFRKSKAQKIYHAASGGRPALEQGLAKTTLSNQNAVRLLSHVVRHPGSTLHQIAETLRVHSGTIRWHVKKLEEVGYVTTTPETPRRVYATPPATSALAHKRNHGGEPTH